ncbi:hypothetical protein QC763_401745 [Podospora pseudopauciseta]|uniref:Secreted protein n=2 Tax=Podospora TaxID=5144 RepID=A0ABR0HBJ2_9PEZI|nr:hypothetical protein QC763_401745 [Podospora pseudopauciseta]KAK4676588.1 hypothetical protein QC764_401745 [Podospora pseudoanserina]
MEVSLIRFLLIILRPSQSSATPTSQNQLSILQSPDKLPSQPTLHLQYLLTLLTSSSAVKMMFNPTTIFTAILGATFLVAPAIAAPAEEVAAPLAKRVWLSNIDVQAACKEQYTNEYVAIDNGNGCGAWQCVINNNRYSVNMDSYCVRHHGGEAYASCGGGTKWDWQCHDRS